MSARPNPGPVACILRPARVNGVACFGGDRAALDGSGCRGAATSLGAAGDRRRRRQSSEVTLRNPAIAAQAWPCLKAWRRLSADAKEESLVFSSRRGTPLIPNNLRNRVLAPAAKRAGLSGVGFHALRHTCASLLIERGLSPLRLQRWMGHHSAAYTLDVYGHLIDTELAPPLDLDVELGDALD